MKSNYWRILIFMLTFAGSDLSLANSFRSYPANKSDSVSRHPIIELTKTDNKNRDFLELDTSGLNNLKANTLTVYKNNPVLQPSEKGKWDSGALGSMTVVRVGKIFHMYYEAWGIRGANSDRSDYLTLQIGHATSVDGLHWERDPANPVLMKGTGADWDLDGTWDPFVLYEDGIFKMWYGGGANNHCDWGYAVSNDGVHFVKKGRISHLGNVEDDHLVHDKVTGCYFMYYWDRNHEPKGLYRARSLNETDFDFTRAEPVIIEGLKNTSMYKFTHVIQVNHQWQMFFAEFIRPGCKGCNIGFATSLDGLNWKMKKEDLLRGQDGEVIQLSNDLYFLYYGPDGYFDQAGCDIRVAFYKGNLELQNNNLK